MYSDVIFEIFLWKTGVFHLGPAGKLLVEEGATFSRQNSEAGKNSAYFSWGSFPKKAYETINK